MARHRAHRDARRQLNTGTPLSDRPATVETDASTWWDDERAFVGSRPKWSLIFIAWLIPAVIAMLQSAASYLMRDALVKEWPWVLMQLPRYLMWALCTPLVFAAVRRFPFRRDHFARSVWTHTLIALAFASVIELVWLLMSLVLQAFIEPEILPRMLANWPEIYSAAILSRMLGGAFMYGATAGIATRGGN